MKRILITGTDSYIGTHLRQHLASFPDAYAVTEVSTQPFDDAVDFHGADAIVHVAAIVHRKETKETLALYDAVNCDLAVRIAEKAKREGVKQFVLFSTMSVYGMDAGVITRDTVPQPKTAYGRSKLAAERRIAALADDGFTVTVLRPPMVFGPGAKGNPARLERLSKRLPFCPDFENRRSMVSIDTLCERIRSYLDAPRSGVVFPQEASPIATKTLIAESMRAQGRRVRYTKLLNPAIRVLKNCSRAGKKAFGDLVYEGLNDAVLPLETGEEKHP
jgi:UDP-glucose 4-epimerase